MCLCESCSKKETRKHDCWAHFTKTSDESSMQDTVWWQEELH